MNYSECRVSQVFLNTPFIMENSKLPSRLPSSRALIILDAPDKTPEYKFTETSKEEKWWSNCMIVWEKILAAVKIKSWFLPLLRT